MIGSVSIMVAMNMSGHEVNSSSMAGVIKVAPSRCIVFMMMPIIEAMMQAITNSYMRIFFTTKNPAISVKGRSAMLPTHHIATVLVIKGAITRARAAGLNRWRCL